MRNKIKKVGRRNKKKINIHKIKRNMIVLLTLIFGSSKDLKHKKIMKKNLYKNLKYKRYYTWNVVGRCVSINYIKKKLKLNVKSKKMRMYLKLNIDLNSKTLIFLSVRHKVKSII